MTDWYVDSAAAGDESAQTPANAHLNVFSLCAAGSVQLGDRVWISKRYFDDFPGNTTHELNRGAGGATASEFCHIIGWPNAGDPFYNQRPEAGVTAGWDSHTQSNGPAVMGNYPTFSSSLSSISNGIKAADKHAYYNLNLVNSSTGAAVGPPVTYTAWYGTNFVHFDNIGYGISADFDQTEIRRHGRMRVLCANGTGQLFGDITVTADFVHVLSGSYFDNMIDGGTRITIGGAHFDTASYNYLVRGFLPLSDTDKSYYFGRLSGIKPVISAQEKNSSYDYQASGYCDDYFGEGPALIYRESGWTSYIATSAQLMYGSSRAVVVEIGSGATSGYDNWQSFPYRQVVDHYVSVSSGTPIGVTWPFITYNSSLFHNVPASILVLGGLANKMNVDIGSRNTVAGSATGWSGTSAGIGSPWTMVDTITPQFSGTMVLRLGVGNGVNSLNTAVNSAMFIAAIQPVTV